MELFQKRRRILWGAWGGVSERLGKDNVWGGGGVKIAKKKITKVWDGFFLGSFRKFMFLRKFCSCITFPMRN